MNWLRGSTAIVLAILVCLSQLSAADGWQAGAAKRIIHSERADVDVGIWWSNSTIQWQTLGALRQSAMVESRDAPLHWF